MLKRQNRFYYDCLCANTLTLIAIIYKVHSLDEAIIINNLQVNITAEGKGDIPGKLAVKDH